MRIEDLDPPRVREGSAASILRDHEWLGLEWDEGPAYQSERDAAYERALEALRGAGRVFACSCTRKEIEAALSSAPHGEAGRRVYPGTCYDGPRHSERPLAQRFRIQPEDAKRESFVDRLQGPSNEPLGGDFVVRRSDGLWAYQLAVVVDDAAQGVTEVVRGSDLLGSTPRQLALYDALGHVPPAFLHVGLVRGDDGSRLSKRHGGTTVGELREAGWSRERVLGWLAQSLGLQEKSAPVDLASLRETFDLARVPPGDVQAPSPAPER